MSHHGQTVFLLENMQPTWLRTDGERRIYAIGSNLMFKLFVLLGFGLILYLCMRIIDIRLAQIFHYVIGGLAGGLIIWLASCWRAMKLPLKLIAALLIAAGVAGFALSYFYAFSVSPIVGAIVGLAISLLLGRVDVGSIRNIRTFGRIAWIGTMKNVEDHIIFPLFMVGNFALMFGLFGVLVHAGVNAITNIETGGWGVGWRFGAAAGLVFLCYSAISMFLEGLEGDDTEGTAQSYRSIWISARNALIVGIAIEPPIVMIFWIIGWLFGLSTAGVMGGLLFGSVCALAVGLCYGGLAFIQHFVLRLILYWNEHIPWSYSRFLNFATERMLLNKVGRSYIFIHGLLQAYFAEMLDSRVDAKVIGSFRKDGALEIVTGASVVRLRSAPTLLSKFEIIQMIREKGFNYPFVDAKLGLSSAVKGTFQHKYELRTFNDGKVIIDQVTGLMWQQSGSREPMLWEEPEEYIEQLNGRCFAEFSDWRLPTLEELASLLELTTKNWRNVFLSLHIDTVFDNRQISCRSSDRDRESASRSLFNVDFELGYVSSGVRLKGAYVRAVRSI